MKKKLRFFTGYISLHGLFFAKSSRVVFFFTGKIFEILHGHVSRVSGFFRNSSRVTFTAIFILLKTIFEGLFSWVQGCEDPLYAYFSSATDEIPLAIFKKIHIIYFQCIYFIILYILVWKLEKEKKLILLLASIFMFF